MTDVLLYPTVYETDLGGSSVAVPLAFLLDAISTAASGAFSTRKLRSAYGGSALRIRRSSDNTEQDIGFTTSGALDVAGLLSFTGANDGFVTKWYDQSGNGLDVAQATAGRQPQLVTSGAVIALNGNPALKGIAANFTAFAGPAVTNYWTVSAFTTVMGMQVTTIPTTTNVEVGGPMVLEDTGTVNFGSFNNPTAPAVIFNIFDGVAGDNTVQFPAPPITTGTPYSFFGKFNGTTMSGWINGGSPTTHSSGNVSGLGLVFDIFGRSSVGTGAGFFHDGYLTEVITFKSSLASADLNILGAGTGIILGPISSYIGSGWSNIP